MSESEGSGAGQREVAYRIFAAEFEGADYDFSESDEERAPNYVITPTGARANRLFVVGVLTEIEQVSEDVLRARVVDPTGAFVLYAGQYQPDEQAFLEKANPPAFVAVTGKARTFQPDDSDQVFTSIRPESISEVDAETRDRWTVQTAEQTVDRIRWLTTAQTLDSDDLRADLRARGAEDGLAHGIALAIEHYDPTPTYLDTLYELSLDAARVVAGEADEVVEFNTQPDAGGDMTIADLAAKLTLPGDDADVDTSPVADVETNEETTSSAETSETEAVESPSSAESEPAVEDSEPDSLDEPEPEPEPEPESTDTEDEPSEPAASGEADSPAVDSSPEPDSEDTSAADASGEGEEDELGDFEPEEFELEEDTREEIEEEFGTEFQSGSEVDEPGNADIDTPDPEELADETAGEADSAETDDEPDDAAETASETTATADSADESAPEADESDADESESADSVDDPQEAVVDLMAELDDGAGAAREDLIDAMAERYGIDSEATEEAIQGALMDGQCYEPDDDHLKPI